MRSASLVALALLGPGYFVAALGSIELSRLGDGIAGVWMANVIAFAVMHRHRGINKLLAYLLIFTASYAANTLGGSTLAPAMLFSLVNVGNTALSLHLLDRSNRVDAQGELGVRGFATILCLTLAAAAVSACTFGLAASATVNWPLFATAWTWWSANALGLAVLLPICLFAGKAEMARLTSRRVAVQASLVAGIGSFVMCVALSWGGFPFVLAMLPLLVAAVHVGKLELAFFCGVTGLALLIAPTLSTVPGLTGGAGAFQDGFQLAVAITAITPFLGGLLIGQMQADKVRIARGEQRFRRAMQDSPIGVCIVGLDGRIHETNKAFAAMLGYTPAEMEQKTFIEITHPDDLDIGVETMRKVMACETIAYRFEKRYLRKDGTALWAQLSGSIIQDEVTGKPLHLVSQVEDIDARKKSEAAIAEAETRWNFALAAAGQGSWELDLRKGGVTYSSTWKQMLGYAFDDHAFDGDPDLWLKMVHPDDLDRVTAQDRDHMQGKTANFESEFRMRHKDGHWIWILDRGRALEHDEHGHVVRAIGTLTDITRRKQIEERLLDAATMIADEKERLRVTLHAIGDAVICTDAANRVTFMNPVAEMLTGVAEAEAIGKSLGRVYWTVDEETGERLGLPHPTGNHSRVEQNSRAVLVRIDDSRCSIRQVVSSIVNDRQEYGGSVVVFQDFTDARTLQRELHYAASHDTLTGLANRSNLLRTMQNVISSGEGADHQFLFIDLDNFKTVNDTGGHAAGDALLKTVADTIREVTGAHGTAARLGGDEFAVLLHHCGDAGAARMAQALVDAIGRLGYSTGSTVHEIGASIGMTAARGTVVEDIIAKADEACYLAKAGGRGKVVVLDMDDAAAREELRAPAA